MKMRLIYLSPVPQRYRIWNDITAHSVRGYEHYSQTPEQAHRTHTLIHLPHLALQQVSSILAGLGILPLVRGDILEGCSDPLWKPASGKVSLA